MRFTFEERPWLSLALAALGMVLVVVLTIPVIVARRDESDLTFQRHVVEQLDQIEQLTLGDMLDPSAYSEAVQLASADVDLYLTTDTAKRDTRMAEDIDRARLAYLAAYWLWLEQENGTSQYAERPEVVRALKVFPELRKLSKSAEKPAFANIDDALNLLWSLGDERTDSLVARVGGREAGERSLSASSGSAGN